MAYRPRSTDGEIVYYLLKDADNAQGWVEIPYEVEYTYHAGCQAYISGPPESCYPAEAPEIEILKIWKLDEKEKRVAEVPEKDWAAEGFDKETLQQVEDKISDAVADMGPDDGPEYEPDDREPDFGESVGKTPIVNPTLSTIAWRVAEPPPGGQQEGEDFRSKFRNHRSFTWFKPKSDKSYVIYYEPHGDGEIEVIAIVDDDDKTDTPIPVKDWEKQGFDHSVLYDIAQKALENEADLYDPTDHDRAYDNWKDGPDEALTESGPTPFKYRINNPGHPAHDLEYTIWYTLSGPKSDAFASGNQVDIEYITRAGDDTKKLPQDHWEKFGFTADELEAVKDAINDAVSAEFVKYGPQDEAAGKWARTKGGIGDWPAGTEVTITKQTRSADGSRQFLLQGPGGKMTQMSLDPGEDPGQYLEILDEGNSMSMEEMRGLAGLPVKQMDGNIKVTEADRAVQKDWRRMAINPSKNLMETSETTGGAIVPANFVFPDLGALLGYTQQKLPVTLLRSIDRMTPEGQNAMALMLNELQKLRPAADHLVEVFAGIVDGIDKFDAGSIEGREVARVFRYMMDAARFTQGGAELTEQL